MASADVRAFQFAESIDQLAGMLLALGRGRIPKEVSRRLTTPLQFVASRDGLRFQDGRELDASRNETYESLSSWPRFETGMESKASFPHLVGQPGTGYTLFEKLDRQFRAEGRGGMGEVATMMGICGAPDALRGDGNAFVRILAPVPIQVIGIEQTPDRASVVVTLNIGPTIEHALVVCKVVSKTLGGARVPACSPTESGITKVTLPLGAIDGKASVIVTHQGHLIQEERIDILKRPRRSARLVALRMVEAAAPLLEAGLARSDGKTPPNQYWFERSCTHLISLLGFSVLWWGPEIKAPDKALRMPMPQNANDAIAFSADETVTIMLEATTEQPGTEKITKLVGRVRRMQEKLDQEVGESAPTVFGVLALPIPYSEVSETIRTAAERDQLALLTSDVVQKCLDLLACGAAHEELEAVLPVVLAHGLRGLRRFRIWG